MRVIGFYFDILGRITLTILLGFVIGYGLAWAVSTGYFQTWRQLPPPPAKATALIMAARESIYIQAADGQTYRCTDGMDDCWIRESAPTDQPISSLTRPCISSQLEFSLFANTPRNVVDCLQATLPYPDAYGRFAYILDEDGRLWVWSHITGAYTNLLIAYVFPSLGVIVGLVIGILWARRTVRKAAQLIS